MTQQIPAGEYDVWYSGFRGASEYRSMHPVKKNGQVRKIFVDNQVAKEYVIPIKYGTPAARFFMVKELENANKKLRVSSASLYVVKLDKNIAQKSGNELNQIFSPEEINFLKAFTRGEVSLSQNSEVEMKLYQHFADRMPYGVQKARTGDPEVWFHETLERML